MDLPLFGRRRVPQDECKRDGPKSAITLMGPICKYARIEIDDASHFSI